MSQSALFVDRPSLLLVESGDGDRATVSVHTANLRGLCQMDAQHWKLVWIGNEDAVALGRVSERRYARACAQIDEALTRAGIRTTADYTCAYAIQGVGERKKDSVFRLPNVGALKAARLEFDVRLDSSWVISDRAEAMLSGSRGGARTALVRSERNERRYDVTPDLVADDLGSAVRFLERLHGALTR